MVGDSKNRSGGPLDGSVGCSGHDLSVMGDGAIKKRLEHVARIVKEIQDPIFLEAMANMGQQVTPPSQAHVLVVEALIIILTPQTAFHNHIPFSSLRGVTWTKARHILGHPDKLWAAIARVDAYKIPPANLSTLQVSGTRGGVGTQGFFIWTRPALFVKKVGVRCLWTLFVLDLLSNLVSLAQQPSLGVTPFSRFQAYIEHDQWPCNGDTSTSNGGPLDNLAAWVCSTIEIAFLLTNAGGCPETLCHYSTAHAGLLASVVSVFDDPFCTQSGHKIDVKRG